MSERTWYESIRVEGGQLLDKVAQLIREGNVRRIVIRQGDRTVAVGVASFGFGWGSIHGMRTAKDQRGRGHAARVLATLAGEMQRRGLERVFLQVDEDNPARSLYRRGGFELAWRYHYWGR